MQGVPQNTLGSLARRLALYAGRSKMGLTDAYSQVFGNLGAIVLYMIFTDLIFMIVSRDRALDSYAIGNLNNSINSRLMGYGYNQNQLGGQFLDNELQNLYGDPYYSSRYLLSGPGYYNYGEPFHSTKQKGLTEPLRTRH